MRLDIRQDLRGDRGVIGIMFMALITDNTFGYWLNSFGNPSIDIIVLLSIGFLIYGLAMLIAFQVLKLKPRKGSGTAEGITELLG